MIRPSAPAQGTVERETPPAAEPRTPRALAAVLALLLLAQFLSGMVVNLYVQIPQGHPGATGSDYFQRLLHGVPWAVLHGGVPLQVHAALGLLLIVGALLLVVLAIGRRQRVWLVTALVGAGGLVGAGFNGGSFLNYGHAVSSLLMSLGFAVALAAYGVGLSVTRAARAR